MATTVSSRSANRLPAALSAPQLPCSRPPLVPPLPRRLLLADRVAQHALQLLERGAAERRAVDAWAQLAGMAWAQSYSSQAESAPFTRCSRAIVARRSLRKACRSVRGSADGTRGRQEQAIRGIYYGCERSAPRSEARARACPGLGETVQPRQDRDAATAARAVGGAAG